MIHRARLVFIAAVIASLAIVATQFPLGDLLHARSSAAAASAQLARLRSENRSLARQVSALRQPATVERIAHESYGLVAKGESSVVVLPSPAKGSGDPLDTDPIPHSDIVPSDSLVANPAGAGSGAGGEAEGFWSRLVNRLEFWKAVR